MLLVAIVSLLASVAFGAVTRDFDHDGQAGPREYTYDANGNTLSVTTRAPDCVVVDRLMNWTADNRLRWVSVNGDTTSYRYDADGQRISKSGPGGTTHYFGKLFEVEDPAGAARLVKYYYAGDVLLAREESGARRWYHQDHLGSVRAITDSGGNRTVAYDYRVFGETTSGSANNTRGFGAHWRDDESNLVYMGARYHDPVLGRFTQPDPLVPEPGDPQSWNRYSYVRNNPFNRIDPTGNIDVGAELGGFLADRFGANRQLGQFLGSLAAGAVPGAGELADLGVVFSLDHRVGTIERLIATGSLVASVATLGASPNAGGKVSSVRAALDESATARRRLPDDAPVVRGGVATPEQIASGTGPHRDVLGLEGFSAQSRAGATVEELAATGGPGNKPFPNRQVSVSTVGDLRCIGCEVVPSPGAGANHVTVAPGRATPAEISDVFVPRPNPARRP